MTNKHDYLSVTTPPFENAVRSKGLNGSLFTSSQMQAAAASAAQQVPGATTRLTAAGVTGDGEGMRSGGGSLGSLGMGNLNLESQMYTSTSLMATGNTHHIFDSTPPIQVRERDF